MASAFSFVRLATDIDAQCVKNHLSAAQNESKQYRGTLVDVVPSGLELTFVAGYGTTVMGSARVVINGTDANLLHVFVTPDAREVGLADSLITSVLSEAKKRGVSYITGKALPGDRATKNLFERHGLVAQTIIVGKLL